MNRVVDWQKSTHVCESCKREIDLDREPEALHDATGLVLCAECRKDEA